MNVYLGPRLVKRLRSLARRSSLTQSSIIRSALEAWAKEQGVQL